MNSYSATVCIATSSFSHKSILKIKNRGLKILVNDTGKRISKKFLLKHKQKSILNQNKKCHNLEQHQHQQVWLRKIVDV